MGVSPEAGEVEASVSTADGEAWLLCSSAMWQQRWRQAPHHNLRLENKTRRSLIMRESQRREVEETAEVQRASGQQTCHSCRELL